MVAFSIAIGSYKLVDFVRLNICQCKAIFGDDTPILVSDDRSPQSEAIRSACDELGAAYMVGEKRRSHFSGDIQAFINAAKFAEMAGVDICLKLSQRFIPVTPDFKTTIEEPFVRRDTTLMVVPGKMNKNQIARSQARFYSGFGLLTDCVAWRPSALSAESLEKLYRDRLSSGDGKNAGRHLVEPFIGFVAATHLRGNVEMLDRLSNHRIGEAKMYLRKSQSNQNEYRELAKKHGLEGEFSVAEWVAMEGNKYLQIGPIV